ncbi:MAG: glycosyltransferase family 2 protein [Rhodospirillaceae bacterium]|nr:glycosyltransferase family 2 protein [Rhodospirillaceae bacterium]
MTDFAVVIPLYNKGPHISRALDSVLRQTFPPRQIFLIDDASTDNGLEIASRYTDPRIRVLQRTTPGPGGYAARNLAILTADADWIAFLDADDAWLPGHLASLHKVIVTDEHDDLACVFAGYTNVYADGRQASDRFSRRSDSQDSAHFHLDELLAIWLDLGECPIWTSASTFRRQALIESGLFPAGRCSRGGDKDLWLRVAYKHICASAPDRTAIYYRDSINMVTRTSSTAGRHCLCETIAAMLNGAPLKSRRLLKRLFNQEVFQHAMSTAKTDIVRRNSWHGFHWRTNPLRFLVLTILSTRPGAYAAQSLLRAYTQLA